MGRFFALVVGTVLALAVVLYFVGKELIAPGGFLSVIDPAKKAIDPVRLEAVAKLVAPTGVVLAALISAFVAALASRLLVNAQKEATIAVRTFEDRLNNDLADKQQAFLKGLEDRKAELIEELEEKKLSLSKELEQEKTRLARQTAELDRRLAFVQRARTATSEYQRVLSMLRSGVLDSASLQAAENEMITVRDLMSRGNELFESWVRFQNAGLYLRQRAEKLSTRSTDQYWLTEQLRGLWVEIDQEKNRELGVSLAARAELVYAALEAERNNLLGAASPAS
jgi:ATP-dependent Lon protease